MDSFYAAPRQPPRAPTINPIERIPSVPEVSLCDNSGFPACRGPKPRDYNDKDFSLLSNSSFSKKHVRFNNPNFLKENVPQVLKTVPDFGGKSFKQIYMANVPDRHLDLTMFEPVKTVDPVMHFGGRNFEMKANERLQSVENTHFGPRVKEKQPVLKDFARSPPKLNEICVQTDPSPNKCGQVALPDSGPTITDLYNIMKQQNEQIMLLQQQVNELKCGIRQPEIDSVERNFLRDLRNSPNKHKPHLVSVGFKKMSYEISYHTQQPKFRIEEKIDEVAESATENSLINLEESLDEAKNSYVSNLQSIAFEKEYLDKIEVSDEEETEIDDVLPDIMNDVERFLRKRIEESRCQMGTQDKTRQTVKAMKQATLAHLKDIGINLPPIQESNEVTESELDININQQSEINRAVQELLMKYLPDEKLAKVAKKPKVPTKKSDNAEMSLGTLQYLKKYNLIGKIPQQEKQLKTDPQTLHLTALRHKRDYL